MTNSTDRLNRIEAILESTSQRIDSNARVIEGLSDRIDSNAKAIAANSAAIAEVDRTLFEAAGRTLRAVDELREVLEEDRVNFREFTTTTQATLASVSASLERQDRILDYLINRNGNGNQA